jgi:hypothetical protein
MAISFVQLLAGASTKTPGTTLAISVPAAGAKAGSLVVVYAGMVDATARNPKLFTCADNKGNTYVNDNKIIGNASVCAAAIFTSRLSVALVNADTITVSWVFGAPSVAAAMSAQNWSGATNALDQVNDAIGTSTTPASGPVTTLNPNDLWLGAVAVNGPTTEVFTQDTTVLTWTTQDRPGTTGAAAGSNITLNTASVVTSTVQTEDYNPTLGTSEPWWTALATVKDDDIPAVPQIPMLVVPLIPGSLR